MDCGVCLPTSLKLCQLKRDLCNVCFENSLALVSHRLRLTHGRWLADSLSEQRLINYLNSEQMRWPWVVDWSLHRFFSWTLASSKFECKLNAFIFVTGQHTTTGSGSATQHTLSVFVTTEDTDSVKLYEPGTRGLFDHKPHRRLHKVQICIIIFDWKDSEIRNITCNDWLATSLACTAVVTLSPGEGLS